MNEALLDAFIAHGVDVLRYASGTQRRIVRLLEALKRELVGGVTELKGMARIRAHALLAEMNQRIDATYREAASEMLSATTGLAEVESAFVAKVVAGRPVAAPTLAELAATDLVFGAPQAEWWQRQSGDTRFRYATAVRMGIANDDSPGKIVTAVRGVMDVTRKNAESLVRGSVATISTSARLAAFRANADMVAGVRQVSTLDSRTSDICIAYDGAEWDLDGNPRPGTDLPFNGGPPRHWNCRSTLVPITPEIPGLALPRTERAAEGGPTKAKTFAEWLKTKPESYQNKLLGRGKAELWRSGKITLRDLLDFSGNPLTLDELRDKVSTLQH